MATHGWGTDHPLKDFLFDETYRFDFFQAVKLLEIIYSERTPVGTQPDPLKETVMFKSRVSAGFPASEVQMLEGPDNGYPAQMVVNFMGLAGANSPLPASYTELLLERVSRKDFSLLEFLNIFNHRLVSLMYRIRKKYHIGFEFAPPYEDHIAEFLYSLVGLGTDGLQQRMRVKDRALVFYTGLFNQKPHSMIGLECILSHYFQFRVKGEQYHGHWYPLEPDQYTLIGRTGQNQLLGQDVVLGTRVWDIQGRFRLHLGPLNLRQFLDILPIGTGYAPLCELTRYYVGQEFEFDFQLTLNAEEVPASQLGGELGPRLGWTAYLKTRDFTKNDSQVKLTLQSGAFLNIAHKEFE